MRKIIVALLVIMATMMACTSIDCPVNNTVFTRYTMLKPEGVADTLKG